MTTEQKTKSSVDEELLFAEPLGVVYENGREIIRGYATVFNRDSENVFGMVDRIAPTAFDGGILSADIFALFAHNFDQVLGRTRSGTLRLQTDRKGLLMEIDPPESQFAQDLMASIKRGDITGGSMGITFSNDDERFEVVNKGKPSEFVRRTINKVTRLFEVTITPIPRIKDAQVGLARARFDLLQSDERAPILDTDRKRRLRLAQQL